MWSRYIKRRKMKKLIYILIAAFTVLACKQEQAKDYITFSGKISNASSETITVMNPKIQYKKEIKLNDDGTFRDTIKAADNYFSILNGKEYYATLYAKNGDEINVTLDAKNLNETLNFSGKGSKASTQMAKANLLQEEIFNDKEIFKLKREAFDTKLNSYTDNFLNELENISELDSSFIADQKKSFQGLKGFISNMYSEKHYLATNLSEGVSSPKFNNYENYAGGTTSLDDLKGKYVYIDLWATWCGPCKVEIPYLKKIETDYHDKNIAFVSISIDRKSAYEKWRKMVEDKQLTGIQLYANEDERFLDAYKVAGIPRFILLDPKGNIISPDAPRPSNPALIKLFEDLKI